MISPDTLEDLFWYAAIMQPMEMCGLMFSEDRFASCPNEHVDQKHGFEISHESYFRCVEQYREQPWATVHSHPNGPANLSGRDCQLLDALELVENPMKMVIVGLKPMQIRVYSKVEGQYQVEWKWDRMPMEETGVLYATNT